MRPIQSTMTEIDHLPGEEVAFTIGDARWVMRSMADLYSNRELAVIREYSTNARDAMIEAGKSAEPIRVTLPSAMNPYFSIQDFGIGMSESELKEIYTKFGESTKRASDDFNGMLGFGCKSAVAYTNSFTVTAVKNGWKTVAAITRKEDYAITLKVIMSTPTSEKNGVTVQVPVHNWKEFEQKAHDFYRFWLPGTVLVNGRAPEQAVGEKIGDGLYYSGAGSNSYVVMGNVPYRIANPDALFPRGMNRISFVAYVPNGAVEFTPSREDLKYSDHTKAGLQKVIDDFVKNSVETAKKEIGTAKTHAEAFQMWTKWTKVIGQSQVDDLSFKGDKFVNKFPLNGTRWDRNLHRYSTHRISEWFVEQMERTLIITESPVSISSSHKSRVREYMGLKSLKGNYVVFTTDSKVDSPWVDQSRVVEWEKVKEETPQPKKVRTASNPAPGRLAGSFDRVTKAGRQYEMDVPSTKELYYVPIVEHNKNKDRLKLALNLLDLDWEVVLVPANRQPKFLRFYPHAKDALSALRGMVKLDGPSMLSKEAVLILSTNNDEARILGALDSNKILDPELAGLIHVFKKGESNLTSEYTKHMTLANIMGLTYQFKKHGYDYWNRKGTPLSEKYPLAVHFDAHGRRNNPKHNEHIYFYLNAAYTARKEGKNV